ncbi:MAG: hypothetical protein AAF802_02950 [Planctomycetota bacterium]
MRLPLSFLLLLTMVPSLDQSNASEPQLANIDAAATMLGSIGSWIQNEPEAAIHAFKQHKAIESFVRNQRASGSLRSGGRLQDRMAQIDAGLKSWDDAVERFHRDAPKQIATELKRQSDAVARYQKSRYPRPSSFAYIPKTVWKTKNKLDVLTASGFDTKDLVAEQQRVQREVLSLVATLDPEQLAKSNGAVRDRYQRGDRESIEGFVKQQWAKRHGSGHSNGVIMPDQSWSTTYSAHATTATGKVLPCQIERMTVYVAVPKSDTVTRLHPMRLQRATNGISEIATNEFAFDVLRR